LIILDTHTWIWMESAPAMLGTAAAREIKNARRIGISAISCWEFAMLVRKGRISLDRDPLEWMQRSLDCPGRELLPITPAVATASAGFGGDFHGDPADRIIVATALMESATLISKDERIRRLQVVRTVW